jgi:hypothetical protein
MQYLLWRALHPAFSKLGLNACVPPHLQVQAQVERLAGLITAARAPTHGAAVQKPTPAKQAADSQAATSNGQASGAGTKRGTTDGPQRQPRKQQKQKHTKQSAVAA